jgi:hypothetical protein
MLSLLGEGEISVDELQTLKKAISEAEVAAGED